MHTREKTCVRDEDVCLGISNRQLQHTATHCNTLQHTARERVVQVYQTNQPSFHVHHLRMIRRRFTQTEPPLFFALTVTWDRERKREEWKDKEKEGGKERKRERARARGQASERGGGGMCMCVCL